MSTFKLFTLGLALLLGLAAQMVTAAPMAQADADAIFAAQDTNGDGTLDAQELSASLEARVSGSTPCAVWGHWRGN
ncbi:hypothetical protein HKCCA1058_05645 [Rhodobacterales bacterium HKCCA1058]|nr:hypothetical protein [Rhodobacterales bacterium HKCCA1058]